MTRHHPRIVLYAAALLVALYVPGTKGIAQYVDHFNGTGPPKGWVCVTGDGQATIDFKQANGIASLYVDATHDKMNIWWAITRHRIHGLDMRKLVKPEYELRVETRIRVSHAPRRVNLHVNHQRTTDFHSHLMEFDIPDTTHWHTISMTTRDFETQHGDSINAHLALMDWGLKKYRVDFDYFKVDVVNRNTAAPDLGNPLPYHPPLADPADFSTQLDAVADATIDSEYREHNFNDLSFRTQAGATDHLLSVNGTQLVILRWNVEDLKGKHVNGPGLLELSPFAVQRSPAYSKDFGMVRISEILSGDPEWQEKSVTYDAFTKSVPLDEVINTQMIIDDSVTWNANGKVLFTISQPILQRLIEGKTRGLAIKPLGAVNATFYSRESNRAPRLYFNTQGE